VKGHLGDEQWLVPLAHTAGDRELLVAEFPELAQALRPTSGRLGPRPTAVRAHEAARFTPVGGAGSLGAHATAPLEPSALAEGRLHVRGSDGSVGDRPRRADACAAPGMAPAPGLLGQDAVQGTAGLVELGGGPGPLVVGGEAELLGHAHQGHDCLAHRRM